jgi:hypothetical protein
MTQIVTRKNAENKIRNLNVTIPPLRARAQCSNSACLTVGFVGLEVRIDIRRWLMKGKRVHLSPSKLLEGLELSMRLSTAKYSSNQTSTRIHNGYWTTMAAMPR